jgi:predicted nucleic acid-binding protein
MTRIYVDATTLIALGTVGELDVLTAFDGTLVVVPAVQDEVTTEPAKTNLARFLEREAIVSTPDIDSDDEAAMEVLGESDVNGDVRLVGSVLATPDDETVAIVSDDRRIRTVARGFGAAVTGTIGALVRAVDAGRSKADAKALLRQLDNHGLHMTAELRTKAEELIETAAEQRSEAK